VVARLLIEINKRRRSVAEEHLVEGEVDKGEAYRRSVKGRLVNVGVPTVASGVIVWAKERSKSRGRGTSANSPSSLRFSSEGGDNSLGVDSVDRSVSVGVVTGRGGEGRVATRGEEKRDAISRTSLGRRRH
jgi:hypothetical protein